VAGKTGTAKKLVNGRYQGHNDYNVSFVGFVPSREPAFTIVVVVDTPRKLPAYGSQVAAPIFQRIASEALRHYGLVPTINAPPPLLVARSSEPMATLDDVERRPQIVTVAATTGTGASTFPDLRGMSARD